MVIKKIIMIYSDTTKRTSILNFYVQHVACSHTYIYVVYQNCTINYDTWGRTGPLIAYFFNIYLYLFYLFRLFHSNIYELRHLRVESGPLGLWICEMEWCHPPSPKMHIIYTNVYQKVLLWPQLSLR